MGVFDGSIYRIRVQWDDEPDWDGPYTVEVYTDDPAAYLAHQDPRPDHASVHELHYTVRDTDFSYGDYVEVP
jgi:hypothetical protein